MTIQVENVNPKKQKEKSMRSTNRHRSVQSSLRNRRASYLMQSKEDSNSQRSQVGMTLLDSRMELAQSKTKEYTGDFVIGIATMHKSNAVPVTNPKYAKQISEMAK